MNTRAEVVSSEAELLILVDGDDRPVGTLDKGRCHDGDGRLHRAFSAFVFDPRGRVLLQRRAEGKRLWGGYWSNSCCSHPRAGEALDEAVRRRVRQELGLAFEADYVYRFEYRAEFGDLGTEHELCSVFVGRTSEEPSVNVTEIMDWRWIEPDALDRELAAHPERYTPWLRMEWQRLRSEFADRLPVGTR